VTFFFFLGEADASLFKIAAKGFSVVPFLRGLG
jgi:hypothetical protein